MPVLIHNNPRFNPDTPFAGGSPPVIGAVGTAYDAQILLPTANPAAGNATGTGAANQPLVTTNALPAGMTSLVLDEQFTSTSLDTTKWRVNTDKDWGASQGRVQAFRPGNVAISAATSGGTGNSLKLTSKREVYQDKAFTAGMVETRPLGLFYPIFGMYEARLKMGHMQGFWPAFWLRQRVSASICEVDIMEYFHVTEPGKARYTLHRANNSGVLQTNTNNAIRFFEAPTMTPGWHTYTVSILPEGANVRFKGYLDGPGGSNTPVWDYLDTQAVYWSKTQGTDRADYGNGLNYFDITIQGAQIGGDWVGHPDDPKGYSRTRDACLSGGTKPNACNTTVGGYPIWTDAANYGGTGLSNNIIFKINYIKI